MFIFESIYTSHHVHIKLASNEKARDKFVTDAKSISQMHIYMS